MDTDEYDRLLSQNQGYPYDIGYPYTTVDFDVKPLYLKKQCRQTGREGMRIDDGIITMYATSRAQIVGVSVEVCRTPEAAREFKSLPVRLPDKGVKSIGFVQGSNPPRYVYKIDLDSLDAETNKIVYKLSKSRVEHWNKFYIQVRFEFLDGSKSQYFHSREFRLKSLPKKGLPNNLDDSTGSEGENSQALSSPEHHRTTSMETEDSAIEDLSSPYSSSGSDFTNSMGSFHINSVSESEDQVITKYLEAQTAKIDSLTVKSTLQVLNGDIAYHLPLADPEKHAGNLEEGDIVGFFTVNETKTIIKPLTMDNCEDAVMAGVITRSAYLHAMTPSEKGKTDTVCVIGVVKIKVKGSVQHGERLYASNDDPGVAIPESHLPFNSVLFRNQILLGMAMEGVKPKVLDEVNLVQSFVCIVLGMTTQQQVKAVEDMYDTIRMDSMVDIRKESKKTKRHFWIILSLAAILLILLSIFFYQWFHPGSALRYFMCKQGSIPGHTAQFKYIPLSDRHKRILVKGVEFTFEALQKKTDLAGVPKLNITDPHYYLNIDKCAYGGIHFKSPLDEKEVGGPDYFGVNHNCTDSYYYDEFPVNEWIKYKSPGVYWRNLTKCEPPFHGKN